MLGDNLVHGHRLPELLIDAKKKVEKNNKNVIFGFNVTKPSLYGIANIENDKVTSIEEKPKNPKSNWCVIGLYMYKNKVIQLAKNIKPSKRKELEITDINNTLIDEKSLDISLLGRGYTWFDTGNVDDLFDASAFVKTIETRQGLKIACIEEIAYHMGYITKKDLQLLSDKIGNKTEYSEYLMKLIENKVFDYEN